MSATSNAPGPVRDHQDERTLSLPAKVIVSLRAGVVLAIANVLCVAILAWAYTHVKSGVKEISVTGSAKKAITSDLIVWTSKVTVSNPDPVGGFDQLKIATDKTLGYLRAQGIADRDLHLSSIWTGKNLARDDKGNMTDKVTSYEIIQSIEVRSTDVTRVSDVARTVTGLLKEGVMVESQSPSYLYTKLADLKVEMLAEATKDATARARQIASNSGSSLGTIRDARMGVMQINAANSTDVSGMGNNDTTSLEKEITAVVSAHFELQ